MTDAERINAAIDDPWTSLLLLADCAEEEGDDETAAGYRWLEATKRWPVKQNWQGWRWSLYYLVANPDPWAMSGDWNEFSLPKRAVEIGGGPADVFALTVPQPCSAALRAAARIVGRALALRPPARLEVARA